MSVEEAYPDAAAVLRDAGWAPHPLDGVYTKGSFVMGLDPYGLGLHIKNTSAAPDGPDTPDDPVLAALWLVKAFSGRYKGAHNAGKPEEGVESQAAGTASEAVAHPVGRGDDALATEPTGDVGGFAERAAGGGLAIRHEPGFEVEGDNNRDYAYDAEFDEIRDDQLGLGGEPVLAIDWTPQDFAPDSVREAEAVSQGVAIFGDDLPSARIQRIGQLALVAFRLIAEIKASVQWDEEEHRDVHSHVVTNLDKSTGAYTGGDQAIYDRFIALEGALHRIRKVERYRDDRAEYVRAADRDSVSAFDPEQGWP